MYLPTPMCDRRDIPYTVYTIRATRGRLDPKQMGRGRTLLPDTRRVNGIPRVGSREEEEKTLVHGV